MPNPIKLKVGLEMLSEVRIGPFGEAHALLSKVLGNIVAHPDEAKYRTLKKSNAKIGALLAVSGVKALLIGVGFTEESEAFVLPAELGPAGCAAGLAGLNAQADERQSAESSAKLQAASELQKKQAVEAEKRKLEKLQIQDDAEARKQPGWRAKAAGVKGGRDIVTPSDIGACGNAGG
mmetsp:Transcript_16578/g.55135  ORF Transcript_16578/g.55135 Transcript_16578/m.55135 type:complete len:178 (+) Transcript_16578:83-616(+)